MTDRDRKMPVLIGGSPVGLTRAIDPARPDFGYEVISKDYWIGRRLVADEFRDGLLVLSRASMSLDASMKTRPMRCR